MWVFGYASLVWRPAFPHLRSAPARIDGWARRFWQGSIDHRGVPDAPGRVATLIQRHGDGCWGRVYEVDPAHRADVIARLDHRESGGYARLAVTAHVRGLEIPTVDCVVYIATEDNSNFLGPAPLDEMADQVVRSVGPSGPNVDYVLNLDDALVELGVSDAHVSELATAVRRRLAAKADARAAS